MSRLFELFKYSRMLDLKDGRLGLMGVPINIVPTSILRDLQKGLIDSIGLKKTYDRLYLSAKEGSEEYNRKFIQKHGFTDKRKIINWQKNVVMFSGWGNIEIAEIDFERCRFIASFKNSPFPEIYGKSKYPVDIIVAGFIAGAFKASMKKDIDCVETKCIAIGDSRCEFIAGPKDEIQKKKTELWKKLKLM